jgi:NAD+ synthase
MDWELIEKYTTVFIKNYVHQNGFENVVIGVSGGIDSAVVATLCVKALGADHVHGLLLPFRTSSPESLEHGRLVCETLKISYDVIDISPMVYSYFACVPALPDKTLQIPNKCARERMSILYDYSVRINGLVAGTTNKSEHLIGYCTQYGDSAVAFEPIADLYKTQVFEFARYLGVPEVIINKKPSADLWEGQTDEGELGITYKEMDEILNLWFDHGYSLNEVVEKGYARETVNKIINRFNSSKFKRETPPIALMPNLGLDLGLDK